MRCCAALACVGAVAGALSWEPLGAPLAHDKVVALSSCVIASTGAPVLAYGATDADADTTIRFLAFNGSGWTTLATHTPQFAQMYDHFDLRCVSEAGLYLGLVIDSFSGLSSILKRVPSGGGEDGFEGCYAFESMVYDFDIMDFGDVRMVSASAGNDTLGVSVYDHHGWDQYPAGDGWGPFTPVDGAPAGFNVTGVRVARAGPLLYASYSETPADGSGPATVRVGSTSMSNSTQWQALGAPFAAEDDLGTTVPAQLASEANAGCVCTTAVSAAGEARLACLLAGSVAWEPALTVLSGVQPGGDGVAVVAQGLGGGASLFTVAALEAGGAAVLSAACAFPRGAGAGSACLQPAGWQQLPRLVLPAAATSLSLSAGSGAGSNATVLAVATGPADGTGDAVAAYALSGSPQ